MKQWSNLFNINDLKRLWIGGQIETPLDGFLEIITLKIHLQ